MKNKSHDTNHRFVLTNALPYLTAYSTHAYAYIHPSIGSLKVVLNEQSIACVQFKEWKSRMTGRSAVYVSDKAQFATVDAESTDYLLGQFENIVIFTKSELSLS